jgi:type IV secretory pathway TrbF-like protein
MSFKELTGRPQKYKVDKPPVTSYEKAEGVWDNVIGSARVQAYNWRLMAIIMTFTCLCLVGALVFMSTKSSVQPYVIEVGPDGARAVGLAKDVNYIPKEQEIKYFLSQFVLKTRSLPSDPVVSKQNWTTAYSLMRPEAGTKMTSIVQKDNIVAKVGRETIQVNLSVIIPLSQDSWQIRWNEDVYTNGALKESYKMSGVFTVEFGTPKDEKELLTNPLGIYIKDFSWSREL